MPLRHRVSVKCLLAMLLMGLLSHGRAYADLTYIFTGQGSGSLGQQQFTEALFTITAQGNETLVTSPFPGVYRLDGVSALLEIDGLGGANFSFVPNLSVNQTNQGSNPAVGIADPIQDRSIFFVGNTQFVNYDLRTTLPSIDGRALYNSSISFPTSQGAFTLISASTASFRAVPEPAASLCWVAAMVVGLGVHRRQSKRVCIFQAVDTANGD